MKCNYSFYVEKNLNRFFKLRDANILCNENFVKEINQELFDRLIKPIIFIFNCSYFLFLLTRYKETHKYKFHKTYIFGIGIITIIFSEMSVNYAGKNLNNTIIFYILPLFLILAYLILRSKLIYKKK